MATNAFQWKNYPVLVILKPLVDRFKKHFIITTIVAIACLFSAASLAATSLSDSELAGVSGGGIVPPLEGQSLPQEQQQPASNNSDYLAPALYQNNDGMELAPEIFTILQSTSHVKRERKLLLNGMTQQGVKALNLENLLSSDSIAANNIFYGGNLTVHDVTTGIEVNQLNELYQLHRTQGNLSSSIVGYGYEKIVESRSGSESYDYHVYSSIYQQRLSLIQRTDYSKNTAQVGDTFASLAELNANAMPISLITPSTFPEPSNPVPEDYKGYLGFGPLGEIFDAGIFGDYGVEVEYSGVTLLGVGVRLDYFSAGGVNGNDLWLRSTLTVPEVDFGERVFNGCFAACTGPQTIDFGSLGGNSISGTVKVPGLGPQVDEINLGAGFSLSGSAPVVLIDSGSLIIGGEAELEITPYVELTLDFSQLKFGALELGGFITELGIFYEGDEKTNIKKIREEITVLDEEIDFNLLNVDFGEDRFDTILGGAFSWSDETVEQDNEDIEIYKFNDEADSSFSELYEHTIFTGGQMTGAEAELLALSEGTLSVDNNNIVSLTDSTQQNMRVFNGVNAVSAVAANALNISRLPASSALSQISMQQRNIFIQQR